MAKVIFKESGARLHGSLCGCTYRVRAGKQFMHLQPVPARFRDRIIHNATAGIQRNMLNRTPQSVADMQRIADQYPAINKAAERMFDAFRPIFGRSEERLTHAIIYWYCFRRLPPELDLFTPQLPPSARDFLPPSAMIG